MSILLTLNCFSVLTITNTVIPAKAGIHREFVEAEKGWITTTVYRCVALLWIPAFAGMTTLCVYTLKSGNVIQCFEYSFEWHEEKRLKTIKERGIDFSDVVTIFEGFVVELNSSREGEERTLAIGLFGGQCVSLVYTWRSPVRRIISARPARRKERDYYYEQKRAYDESNLD